MLKVGVVGLGSISGLHLKAYEKHKEVEITALCDANKSRLKELSASYGVTKTYTNFDDLLQDETIDAVSICTWNNTHAAMAIEALEANKHVLVEKPLSITVGEALAVEDAVKKTGKVLQVGFVRRFGRNEQVLKRFIDQDELGDIYYAKASYLRRLGNPGGWFSDKSKSGGGPLIDLGVHVIDLSWYLMGKPRPISVTGNTYYKLGNRNNIENLSFYKAADYDAGKNDVEDLANALIRFENGASLFIDVSFTLHTLKNEFSLKLYGDKGGAEVEPELKIVTEKHQTILNIEPQINQNNNHMEERFENEINHFVASCLYGEENIAPVSDGVQIMKILDAVYKSAETSREILL
ncbi:Gfo/Idh/MocA family oxidoreductase [Cerasibacillus terrae]|uniref:Gfo/Idh/MocA family oxidoreductase n=1 Tax=Cerasibacillus terrae TaxID=2498845 RepID=A0A5C8NIN1_9BACI|nr:Gfo/Idh/MocA family oxidoreductase [Cerasibacillus terrae]TXL61082.1 Gfo/Idh/MocA family oxidoreductase [Cerasibacillus terrae]